MSCITEILRKKGEAEALFMPREGNQLMDLLVEGGGQYKNYEYLITFNDMGFRCGYVAISPDNKFYNADLMNRDEDLCVHGGITFFAESHLAEDILGHTCADKWIGFDAGHAFDIVDLKAVEKYFPNLREARKDHVVTMAHLFEGRAGHESETRTFEFMESECKKLIDQLIEKDAA